MTGYPTAEVNLSCGELAWSEDWHFLDRHVRFLHTYKRRSCQSNEIATRLASEKAVRWHCQADPQAKLNLARQKTGRMLLACLPEALRLSATLLKPCPFPAPWSHQRSVVLIRYFGVTVLPDACHKSISNADFFSISD
jgi:hypothetical protein